MKLFKVYLSFFIIVGLFFGISLFFPRSYKFEKEIVISRPVEEVFLFMNNLRNWEKWSAWNRDMDSSLYFFYSSRPDSLGARQYFNGKILGNGRFVINRYKSGEMIGYDLMMQEGNVHANGTFYFTPRPGGTSVRWVDSGDVGYNPIFRYMIPFKKKSTEGAFEDGLKRIKAAVEIQK